MNIIDKKVENYFEIIKKEIAKPDLSLVNNKTLNNALEDLSDIFNKSRDLLSIYNNIDDEINIESIKKYIFPTLTRFIKILFGNNWREKFSLKLKILNDLIDSSFGNYRIIYYKYGIDDILFNEIIKDEDFYNKFQTVNLIYTLIQEISFLSYEIDDIKKFLINNELEDETISELIKNKVSITYRMRSIKNYKTEISSDSLPFNGEDKIFRIKIIEKIYEVTKDERLIKLLIDKFLSKRIDKSYSSYIYPSDLKILKLSINAIKNIDSFDINDLLKEYVLGYSKSFIDYFNKYINNLKDNRELLNNIIKHILDFEEPQPLLAFLVDYFSTNIQDKKLNDKFKKYIRNKMLESSI